MTPSKFPKNAEVIDSCTTRINACNKYLTSKTEIPVNGELQKLSAIVSVYQQSLDTRSALAETRAELVSALADRDDAESARATTDEAMKGWVLQRFGASSKQARDFGFQPRKVAAKSADTKALAAKLATATRAARGTMSKKEKLKIKGTLPVPTAPAAPVTNTTPVVTPASPAVVIAVPAATPVAAASAATVPASSNGAAAASN
jgi:hypothetical protein